jgi:predicted PurR-regulated permease PerM
MHRIRCSWQGWMKGVMIDMLVTGVLLYLGLMLIGLDYAILFAALSALLVVVPYFGAIAGAFPPVLLALTHSPQMAGLTFAVYLLVQQIEGNIIVPLVMARMLELHPAVIAIGVVVVAQLFGIAGLFVAVPILSAIVIGVEELWVRPQEMRNGVVVDEPAISERGIDGRWLRRLRREGGVDGHQARDHAAR